MSQWKNLISSVAGNVGLFFALSAPTLILVAGGTIDYLNFTLKYDVAQQSVDTATLGAAQMLIENSSLSISEKDEIIHAFVKKNLAAAGAIETAAWSASIDPISKAVSVNLDLEVENNFLQLVGISNFKSTVSAVAQADEDEQPVCILSLDSNATTGIKFSGNGEMKAKDCVVWSNAFGAQSITFNGSGKVSASKICAVGRASSASVFSVTPKPENNCKPVSDPLADWTPPPSLGCTHNSSEWIDRTTAHLDPGVYCGGLRVNAKHIFMRPGIYVVRDGPLILRGESEISGKAVGIFLDGQDTKLEIDGKSKVELKANLTGPMAGIVIASSPTETTQHSAITGRSDLKIGGVIYLPNHDLKYWGESDTRAASPVTTIIAKTIDIGGDAYLEVKNNKEKARYAPVVTTGQGIVRLIK